MKSLYKEWLWISNLNIFWVAAMIELQRFGNVSRQKNLRLSFTTRKFWKNTTPKEMMKKILSKRLASEYSQMKVCPLSSGGLIFHQMENFSFCRLEFGTEPQIADLNIAPSSTEKTSLRSLPLCFQLRENLLWSANFARNCSRSSHRNLAILQFLTTWSLQ